MKAEQLKESYWIVYRLPNADNYVGFTSNIDQRMKVHRTRNKRDTSGMIVEGTFATRREARDFEREFHDKGCPGRSDGYLTIDYDEIVRKRKEDPAYKDKRKAVAATVDYKAIAAKIDYEVLAEFNKVIILQYSKQGEFIKEWRSGNEASKALSISRGGISSCLTGRYQTAGGFIWRYKEE
jgi:hypothetical protein